jgi:hypothetical protein
VLPFYSELGDQHLTDAEWLKRLDSKSAPETPAWLQPLLVPKSGPKQPEKDH